VIAQQGLDDAPALLGGESLDLVVLGVHQVTRRELPDALVQQTAGGGEGGRVLRPTCDRCGNARPTRAATGRSQQRPSKRIS
jgi:hypothetical protein